MNTLSNDDAESKRDEMREDYKALAEGYIRYRDDLRRSNEPVTDALKRLAQIHEGQRVLDLACGVGDPTFAIAEAVGSLGYVVGLDLVEAMVEGAKRWAQYRATEIGDESKDIFVPGDKSVEESLNFDPFLCGAVLRRKTLRMSNSTSLTMSSNLGEHTMQPYVSMD